MAVHVPSPAGPGQDPLQIGAVTFNSEEVPSDLAIGGLEQMEAVHDLVGGGRVEQSLGVKPKDVSWEGWLFAPNVDTRIQQLRAYASGGSELYLGWRTERYYCKVKSFQPKYSNANIAKYEIGLTITRDANGAFTNAAPDGLDDQVYSLNSDASNQNAILGTIDPAGASAFQASLAAMQSAILTSGSLTKLSGQTLTSVQSSVASAISAVGTYVATVPDTDINFVPANRLLSILNLIATNIARGQHPNQLQQTGGSLYAISATKYGDITQAFSIMSSNGFVSPKLPIALQSTINLPPLGATD